MKIMFDFDYTVFDMSAMHRAMEEAAARLGISPAVYRDAYSRETDWKMFVLGSFVQRLARLAGINETKITHELEAVADQAEQWVYGDVIETFRVLQNAGHEVSLLSWGDTAWQYRKISASKLNTLCKNVVPVSQGKADALRSWAHEGQVSVLIDDKPAELRAVIDFGLPIKIIRMRRPGAKYSDQEGPPGLAEAQSMSDVLKIITEWNKDSVAKNVTVK